MFLVDLLLDFSSSIGHFGVLVLMTVESSFVPFPSEVVVPPAAYLASNGEMNIFIVIIFGIMGSLIGASINYFVGMYLGRPLVFKLAESRWAKFLLINKRKIEKSEEYFLKYGGVSTFLGRLVPAVRQLISLPAGFCGMKFHKFLFFTMLGSGFWVIILALLGYYFGENEQFLKDNYFKISVGLLGFVLLFIVIYLIRRRSRSFFDKIIE